jgi:hypothetical protein
MTGWRALLEYQAAGFSSRMRRVFIEQCLQDYRIKDFLRILRQGVSVFVCSAQAVPNAFKEKYSSQLQKQRNHHSTSMGIKSSLFIADNQTSLVQTDQRVCLAQTGDE